MSLLRLLAAGKSLVGLEDSTNRYRPAGKRALPTFPSKANPFRRTAKPDASATVMTASQPELACPPAPPKATSFTARLTALFPPRFKVEKKRTVHAPVQAELSLEGVKVVRNDLSDADLEVVVGGAKPSSSSPATGWAKIAERITSSASMDLKK